MGGRQFVTLYELYCAALRESLEVAANSYLQLLAPHIKEVESASGDDDVLASYCQRMRKLLERKGLMTNGESVGEFAQVFGEAHFAKLCKDRGIQLERIKAQKDRKTPDFRYGNPNPTAHFEVKTLSIVNGGRGIEADLLRALDAQIEIEQQLKKGARIATSVSEMQPYGGRGYQHGAITVVLSTLIEKSRQNIKPDQFIGKSTFLVLNLCLIPPAITDNRALRPAYCDDYLFLKAVTGELWMLAFSKPGMLIHGQPEFEGKPCLEGVTEKLGILEDPEYLSIAGILIVVYPLGFNPRIYGLYRRSDYSRWLDEDEELVSLLQAIVGEQWNDSRDSNGWQLAGE